MYNDQFDHDQDLVIHSMFRQRLHDRDVHDHRQVYEKFFEILHQLNHLDRKLFKKNINIIHTKKIRFFTYQKFLDNQ